MKKGFTLIELLAVIVIIVIIGTIGIYSVTKLINKSRLNSLTDTAYGVKKAASLYFHQNFADDNAEITLDLTPKDVNNEGGKHANLITLTNDPWGGKYNSVFAEVIKNNFGINYSIYLNTSHGCYILVSGQKEVVPSACYSNITKNYTNVTKTIAFNRWRGNFRNIVRDGKGTIHMVYVAYRLYTNNYVEYIYSQDNGQTWSTPYTFTQSGPILQINRNTTFPYLKIDGNDRLHVFFSGGEADNLGLHHYYKDYNNDWSSEYKIGFTHDNDEVIAAAVPAILNNNNLELIYPGGHATGIKSRTWNGENWSNYTSVLSTDPNYSNYSNTLILNNNPHYFYAYNPLKKIFKINGEWQSNLINGFSLGRHDHNEIVDKDLNIWSFNNGGSNTSIITMRGLKIKTNPYSYSSETIDETNVDIMKNPQDLALGGYPTATIDGAGNIYLFYELVNAFSSASNKIVYKIRDYKTGIWSGRKELTNPSEDGGCSLLGVKYQEIYLNQPNSIDISYACNNKLYYAKIKSI